jgi:AraC-like DNA-binding protein
MQMSNNILLAFNETFNVTSNPTIAGCKPHYHNDFEIYYLTRGNCKYLIDETTYELSEGDIAIVPPGIIHNTDYDIYEYSRNLLCFPESTLPENMVSKISNIHYHKNSNKTQNTIKNIFKSIENEHNYPDEFSDKAIKNKIYELALLLIRNENTGEKQKKSTLVEQAIFFIKTNYMSNIDLKQTAAQCFVSPEHLSRTLKKETGFTFREFLNFYRLKKAKNILETHPEYRIINVAMSCGFSDSNYFSKLFKQTFKKSPKEAKKG